MDNIMAIKSRALVFSASAKRSFRLLPLHALPNTALAAHTLATSSLPALALAVTAPAASALAAHSGCGGEYLLQPLLVYRTFLLRVSSRLLKLLSSMAVYLTAEIGELLLFPTPF